MYIYINVLTNTDVKEQDNQEEKYIIIMYIYINVLTNTDVKEQDNQEEKI